VLNMRARSLKTSNSLVLISVQNDGAWSLAAVMTCFFTNETESR